MKDFPAGPMAKNLCCHCRGHGFDPWSGNYNPTCHVALPKKYKSMKIVSVHLALVVKNLSANAGDIRDENSILGSGRSPGEGHSNPLQYSCMENPMNRGAWWATVHRVAQSWAQLKWLTTHAYVCMEAGSKVRDKNCSPNYPVLILMLEFLKSGVLTKEALDQCRDKCLISGIEDIIKSTAYPSQWQEKQFNKLF